MKVRSAAKAIVAKFSSRFECFRVKTVLGSNLKIQKASNIHIVNINQVKICKSRKVYPDLLDDAKVYDPEHQNGNNTVRGEGRPSLCST